MVQSPSWEANWFEASQDFPRISWNPNVHYCNHKCPPPLSILGSQIQSIYPHPTSWRYVLILSTHLRLGLPSSLFPSGFPTKTLYTPSPHPYAPHAQPISFFSILSPALFFILKPFLIPEELQTHIQDPKERWLIGLPVSAKFIALILLFSFVI